MRANQYLLATLLVLSSLSTSAQILVGQTAGFSGPVAAGVKETTDGALLWINAVNAKGGIGGQKIELISLDDKFDPKLSAENALTLVEKNNVVALFLTRGTPNTEAVIPVLDKHGVPLVGPSTGAMVLHQPVQKHVFNVRATYQREAEKAITHLTSIGIERIAIVHVQDSFGLDGLAGAQKGLAAAKLTPVLLQPMDRAKPDYSQVAPAIVKANAQAVLLLGSSGVAADGVKAFRAAGSLAQVVTLSNNASSGFVKALGDQARGVVVSQVFPNSLTYGLVKEATELARVQGVTDVSPAMLEGFAAAKVLVEGLRRAGPKPTRERLQYALDNLSKFDMGGLEINFSPKDHTGMDFADLSIITAEGRFRR